MSSPSGRPIAVLEIIKRKIESELVPSNKACALFDKAQQLRGFSAEFVFQTNLRDYVRLHGQGSTGKKRLSGIISFTSAGSTVDVLGLPTSEYVARTWAQDGIKLLQLVEKALDDSTSQGASSSLPCNTHVSVTIHASQLILKVRGEKKAFPPILEQVCWIVSVTDHQSISLLKKYYAEEATNKPKTRDEAETVHTGTPEIMGGNGGRFKVSFTTSRVETHKIHDLIGMAGHCWKTMAGLSIVASGYRIPSRPRQDSGLEAPLSVLRQLFQRGSKGKEILALDKPLVMIPTRTQGGEGAEAYQLRLMMAVAARRCAGGNAIYWHFDPAKPCSSLAAFEQLEGGIGVASSTLDPRSRHFVGWSSRGEFLAGTSETNAKVAFSTLPQLSHFGLVIPSITLSIQVPPVFNVSASLSREKRPHETQRINMAVKSVREGLTPLRDSFFVLWDTDDRRGWLVNGPAVALNLLRGYITMIPPERSFDFQKLNHIKKRTPTAAFDVLTDHANLCELIYKQNKDTITKPDDAEADKAREDNEEWETLAGIVLRIVDVLNSLLLAAKTIDFPSNGNQGWLQGWLYKRFNYNVRGWDFTKIAGGRAADVVTHVFDRDPGWLRLTRALDAPFLFGAKFGEILQPHPGQCCPYFETLPKGQDYLATGMATIQALVNYQCGYGEPKERVARLALDLAWGRGVDPFSHPHGQGDHLEKVGPRCFPVQQIVKVPKLLDRKDKEILGRKRDRPYSWKEADDLNTVPGEGHKKPQDKSPKLGVVVFGNVPGEKKLKQLAQANSQRKHRSGSSQTSTTARLSSALESQAKMQGSASSSRSSSHSVRSNISASNASGAVKPENAPGDSSPAISRRAPSVASTRSTSSATTHLQPTLTGRGQPGPPTAERSTATAARKPSSASMRTTSWVDIDAKAPRDVQPQTPTEQPPTQALRKTSK